MFEAYINRLTEKNFALFNNDCDKIRFGDIFSHAELSEYLITYFKAELKWIIFKEKINVQSNISTSVQSGDEQLAIFKKNLHENLVIYRDDLKERINYATKIYFNYSIRPVFTLDKFLFEHSFAKHYDTLEFRLGYLHGFENYHEMAKNYLSCIKEEGVTQLISNQNFMQVIKDANAALFTNIDSFDLSLIFSSMVECFTNDNNKVELPIEALLIFFDDVDNKAIYDFVEERKKERSLSILDEDDLQILFNDIALFVSENISAPEIEMEGEQLDELANEINEKVNDEVISEQSPSSITDIEVEQAEKEVQTELTTEEQVEKEETPKNETEFDDLLDEMDMEKANEEAPEPEIVQDFSIEEEEKEEQAEEVEIINIEEDNQDNNLEEPKAENIDDDEPSEDDLLAMADAILGSQ